MALTQEHIDRLQALDLKLDQGRLQLFLAISKEEREDAGESLFLLIVGLATESKKKIQQAIKILLEAGENPNLLYHGRHLYFFLMMFTLVGEESEDEFETLKTLLQGGFDINLIMGALGTVLNTLLLQSEDFISFLGKGKYKRLVKFLIKNGADLDYRFDHNKFSEETLRKFTTDSVSEELIQDSH
jgi:hypothetical protein